MKASEVLRRYRAGHRDFKRVNLRGQSFKGQDLTGADFSEADIRSTNFTGANLRGANFTGAKCGLQRRCATFLVIFSWLLAGISGLGAFLVGGLVSLILDSDLSNQIAGWLSLIVLVSFLILIIRQGISAVLVAVVFVVAVAFAVAGAVAAVISTAFAVVFAVAFTEAVAVAVAVAGVGAGAVAFVGAGAVAVAGAGAGAVAFVGAGAVAFVGAGAVAFIAGAGAVAVAGAGVYIGWRAMKGDERDAWVRSFAIAFAAKGGTSFRGADLTEANFTGARLKSTDLREASLTRVRWFGVKMLDRVRPGDTYLKYAQVQQWLIGKGIDKNFDRKILQGINLQGANLADSSFIGADLSEANLKDTDLSTAKLVQTQLEGTDLTGANLTAATIEDWGINSQTNLENVICDYIYLKGNKQERRPADPNRNFKPGEFANLVEQSIETVDLIFKDGIDWRAFLSSFQDLQVQYGEQNVSIQAIEKKSDGAFVIRLSVPPDANKAEIESYAKQSYETKLKVLEADNRRLLQHNASLENIIYTLASRPITIKAKAVAEKDNTSYEFHAPVGSVDNKGTQTNVTGVVEGDQIGTQYNSPQEKTLAEAAAEIQKLLKQLEKTNPTATLEQQKAYVDAAISPTLKQRCVGALKAGGETAIEEFLDNPYVNVGKAVVKGWMKPE